MTKEQQKAFQGLNYYPENPGLRFETEAIPFEHFEEIEMQTSTGDIQVYRRYGRIHFEADGQPAELTIFASKQGYFLPFVDAMAGIETTQLGATWTPNPCQAVNSCWISTWLIIRIALITTSGHAH